MPTAGSCSNNVGSLNGRNRSDDVATGMRALTRIRRAAVDNDSDDEAFTALSDFLIHGQLDDDHHHDDDAFRNDDDDVDSGGGG